MESHRIDQNVSNRNLVSDRDLAYNFGLKRGFAASAASPSNRLGYIGFRTRLDSVGEFPGSAVEGPDVYGLARFGKGNQVLGFEVFDCGIGAGDVGCRDVSRREDGRASCICLWHKLFSFFRDAVGISIPSTYTRETSGKTTTATQFFLRCQGPVRRGTASL